MKRAFIVFRKELKDTLRDRRTLISMIAVPLLLGPVMMNILPGIMKSKVAKEQEKVLRIAVIDNGNAGEFLKLVAADPSLTLYETIPLSQARQLVESDSLDVVFDFDPAFDQAIDSLQPGEVTIYFKTSGKINLKKQRALQ